MNFHALKEFVVWIRIIFSLNLHALLVFGGQKHQKVNMNE